MDDGLQPRFREVMAGVCTPVSVVTAVGDGRPFGTRVSAFASLSMDPPMMLVALDRGSDLLAVLRRSGRCGLDVLGTEQAGLAAGFARKGGHAEFDGVPWAAVDGVPGCPAARRPRIPQLHGLPVRGRR